MATPDEVEAKARKLCRELYSPLGLVDEAVPIALAALRAAREEPLRDLRKWLIWRIEKHELAANECHDKGRFDLWSEQLKSTEAFGQVLAQVDRLLHSTQAGASDGT